MHEIAGKSRVAICRAINIRRVANKDEKRRNTRPVWPRHSHKTTEPIHSVQFAFVDRPRVTLDRRSIARGRITRTTSDIDMASRRQRYIHIYHMYPTERKMKRRHRGHHWQLLDERIYKRPLLHRFSVAVEFYKQ